MKFNYQARTPEGDVQAGVVEAASKEAAIILLQKYNLFITILEEASAQPIWMRKIKIGGTSRKDIVAFSRQMAIMFKSNIPMLDALHALADGQRNQDFKETILKIAEEVEGGATLSQALGMYPKEFNDFFISMVKSGEASGKLSDILVYLADHLEKEYALRSKIIGAMIYPIFVLSVVSLVLVGLVLFVIPKIKDLLTGTGQALPPVTQFILNLSDFASRWGWIFAVILAILIIGISRYTRTEEGKRIFDRIMLKIPLVGDMGMKIQLARFAENLSTLIAGGLPIAQALEMTADIVGNTIYKDIILETMNEVKKGESISYVLRQHPKEIPPLFIQMTAVGEKTGKLDSSLTNIVSFYEEEIERTLATMLSLLEPVMIIFLGGVVMVIVLAVLMPIYQIVGST